MWALTLGGEGVKLTIGNDADTASAVTKCGAEHQDCKVEDVVIDSVNKVVSTRLTCLVRVLQMSGKEFPD